MSTQYPPLVSEVPTVWGGGNRRRGLRILPKEGAYFVHVTSRIVRQMFLMGSEEKAVFRAQMRKWSEFSGITVLTHCLMDNHFHLLLWVPERVGLGHEEVVRRLRGVWEAARLEEWEGVYAAASEKDRREMDLAVEERTCDLPEFMRVLKQSFSRWYNARQKTSGALWDCRYRSVVVEGSPLALMSVGAYIDLNPVRAGICGDPLEYVWSGYGEGMGGEGAARKGIVDLVRASKGHVPRMAEDVRRNQLEEMGWGLTGVGEKLEEERKQRSRGGGWEEAMGAYRLWLYAKGARGEEDPYRKEWKKRRKGFGAAEVVAEFERRGVVSMEEALRKRCRTFTRGVGVGSEGFLERLMGWHRECFGPKRRKAAKGMGRVWAGLCSLRQVG